MKVKYTHIHFADCSTSEEVVYVCRNNKTGDILGFVEYDNPWRRFRFRPNGHPDLDNGCLNDIVHFMGQLKK